MRTRANFPFKYRRAREGKKREEERRRTRRRREQIKEEEKRRKSIEARLKNIEKLVKESDYLDLRTVESFYINHVSRVT